MALENTIIWGFCGKNGKEIVFELRKKLNVTIWFSDQNNSIDICSLVQGVIPKTIVQNENDILSFNEFYRQHFLIYNIMISRRGISFSNIHELTNEFALAYYYFCKLVREQKTSLVIFSNIPHEGPDYVLYQIAKIFCIKTLLCYQNILPNNFLISTSIKDFGGFHNIPADLHNNEIVINFGSNQKLFYMQDIVQQQDAHHAGGLHLYYYKIKIGINRIFSRLKIILQILTKSNQLNITNILDNRNLRLRYEKQINQRALDNITVRKLLINSKHIIYVPLHLQPELSTSALGGVFQDQLYMIETLRSIFDKKWIILVKENPKQGAYQRGELFFDRLDRIPGLYFVNKLFPSIEIIENVALTATVTGTAGWESIMLGRKCLTFGQAWYASMVNCLNYKPGLTQKDLSDFLSKEYEIEELRESFNKLANKSGLGVVDDLYSGIVSGYNEASNAGSVVRSLMAVINHPATVWA
ncbi:MAG: hypothetical protein ACOYLR_08185 [Chlorobium sp.]